MVNLRLFAGAIVVFLALLCLVPGNAFAIPETFNISFFESGGDGSWTGTYTVDGGVLTAFSAEIASISYNSIFYYDDSLTIIRSLTGEDLVLFNHFNSWSDGVRFGTYNSAAVPEPSALLLLGSGLLVVAYIARRRA